MRIAIPLPLLLLACASTGDGTPQQGVVDQTTLPTGAAIGASGYANIGATPPSAFPEDPPPMPTQLDVLARQTALGSPQGRSEAWAMSNGTEEFQKTFQQLREHIARAEGANFIEVRYIRENGVQGEFLFQREGEKTLRKYTADPRFVGTTADYDAARLRSLRDLWLQRMEDGVIGGLSANTFAGELELDSGLEEAEFRKLAASKGWDMDDPFLAFRFAASQPHAFTEEELASLVRVFAREDKRVSIRLTAGFSGRIVLDDGCFRLGNANGEAGDTLVMFDRQSQLALDHEGHLVVLTGDELYRVGEEGSWGGPNGVDEANPDVRRLREACGNDDIVNVASPQSQRLFALPYPLWVLDYAYTKDITYDAAWDEVIACIERQEKRGRRGLAARDRCVDQYNGWDYVGEELPPPPGQ